MTILGLYYQICSCGNRRSLPSAIFFSAQQRFLPTNPLAPVTSIFIISLLLYYLVLFLPYSILSRSSAPSTPLLTYFYPRSTLKLTTTLSVTVNGYISPGPGPTDSFFSSHLAAPRRNTCKVYLT